VLAGWAERLFGRGNLVRGSRFLLDYARRDTPNKMATNGEWLVQDVVLGTAQACLTVIDVGANVGEWSLRLLTVAQAGRCEVKLHVFEPASATFEHLTRNLLTRFPDQVTLVRSALSDHRGKGILFKVHELAGSNSLHGVAGSTEGLTPETVDLRTLDDYCESVGVETIDLLKVDAEGHDHLVLNGATGLLKRRAIDVIQFEYNYRWIGARRYLKDVFDDLRPLGYEIGKVTPTGIEWYEAWSEELETFREGNYLACRRESSRRFPAITWWARRPSPASGASAKLGGPLERL
jgi:FkbM family methyltransferase